MTAADREAAARRQRAQTIALWRWALIEPAMDPALTARQRGQVVRELAAREHEGPSGRPVPVSRRTIDRWIVARRAGGFDALLPAARQCAPRTDADVVELAAGLKMENPARTAAQVRRILAARLGWAPSERAIQRWFAARELTGRPGGRPPEAFGRFQADAVNEIWTADLMNGPRMAGKATFLAGIIDDRSRFLTGCQFIRRPDAVRFAGVLRGAIARYGIPRNLYTDNGSCFADESLARTCRALAVKLTHSQPGRPMGRGKVERAFGTIQQQFLVEVAGDEQHPARRQVTGLAELNDLLDRWVRAVYHARVHSETGETPQARYAAAGPAVLPEPVLLREAFRWSAVRLVRNTATVAFEGNVYSVDPFLAGRKVELVFDPFDLTDITVYWAGRKVGRAVPQVIGRHAHPKAPPDDDDPAPAALTGIDYLQLVTDADQAALGEQLNLAALDDSGGHQDSGHDSQEGRNAEALPAGQLACLLYDAAEGMCADVAAVMLIDRHGHFLHDPGFRRIIAAGSSITTGQPLAVIRWHAAIHALEAGQLPCTGSERAILRIAASLADPGVAVNLRENLGNLDARNIALVTDAIAAANGGRAAGPARKATR